MFRVIELEDKSVKPALSNWLILNETVTKCHWPLSGLEFKLKNFASPPLEVNLRERKNWKIITCNILLNSMQLFSNI